MAPITPAIPNPLSERPVASPVLPEVLPLLLEGLGVVPLLVELSRGER